ncbi:MAG TPA: DNA-primase RepB domain-containing protein [Solirubrobacteraceae bacterium]|jgi:hypothetical protein|nr:DNA-primase RepB domain-containing protein [Solirubrobacteraceae bacterium]
MSGPQPGEIDQAEQYLQMLTESAPPGSLLDIRYRKPDGRFSRIFLHARDTRAARRITKLGQHSDVYVGCALRVRPRGTRRDLAPTALLWADCDSARSLAAARAFTPQASMIVASGSLGHAHAYWQLTTPLDIQELEDANRRLAHKLGADVKCADATRILRIPGTWNHKQHRPTPVEIIQETHAHRQLADILDALTPTDRASRSEPTILRGSREQDPLHQISPIHYVRLLTGRVPDREGKIACPFHDDDTPSLHAYPTPEQGWACYGCPTPDGKPLGGDIYTLASKLWNIPTRGPAFPELQARLDEAFAIERSAGYASWPDLVRRTALRASASERGNDDRADR